MTSQYSGVTRMTTARVYDRLGRLQSVSCTPSAAGEVPISSAYQYNDAGQRIRCTLGDGTYWLYSYDALGQVTSGNRYMADGTPIAGQQFSYAYDDIGNRTQAGSGGDGDGANLRTESYTRNFLNQYSARSNHRYLEVSGTATTGGAVTVNESTASRQGGRFRSEWSVAGTAAAWQNVDVSLSAGEVVPDRKLYLPPQSESYSHDLDGNMTGDGRWTYTWDGENRLMSASTTSGAYTAGVPGRKVEYTYDWMGRMIRRVGYSGNPITPTWTLTDDTRFAYDGWLCRWESMTNSSAASKPWVSAVKPSTTVRSDYTGWVGMRILTGESPVWVTRLGRWVLSGNSGSHTVKLVTASTGVDVSGGSVSVNTSGASTNRFLYADLASPIQLAANTAYYLVSLETNGGDKWYQNDTVVNPGAGLTVTHAAHGSGGSYWTSASPNNGYGPVNLVGVPTTESRTQLWGLDLSGSEQGAGGVGGLLGTRTGTAATRFMAYDGNGNIVGIVNGSTGKTSATMVYSPFGELIAREGDPERDRYGFSTKWGDGDTGTCYYGYRFHSPELGRWINRDPYEEKGGISILGFAHNDPPNKIDLLGLFYSVQHAAITRTAIDQVAVNLALPKPCHNSAKSRIIAANTRQDKPPFFGDLRRHYNRPYDPLEAGDTLREKFDDEYGSYLDEEERRFDATLTVLESGFATEKESKSLCDEALDGLGRMAHSWQDFYAHAISRDGNVGFNVWLSGFIADPRQRKNVWPSSYDVHVNLAEHPSSREPVDGAEYSLRFGAAQSYTQARLSVYLEEWKDLCCSCYK